jgi:dienelactone hydrolase
VKETHMKTPEWLSPALKGAALGAVALAIVGFSWGGWVTGGTAEKMASDQARLEVVAALVPICIEQSSQDPQVVAMLAQLKDTRIYQRSDMLMKAGWATMPGSSDPSHDVARACMEKLAVLAAWASRSGQTESGRYAAPTSSLADVGVSVGLGSVEFQLKASVGRPS